LKAFIKIVLITALAAAFLGCESKNIKFTAIIDEIYENSLLVSTYNESADFDKAVVFYEENAKPDFELKTGQIVEITILPEIRESYPVQVTAVKITLIKDAEKKEYMKITQKKAKELIDNQDVIILDVRTAEEYDEGQIKDAILIPDYELKEKAQKTLKDKNKTILVYCRSGVRSENAAKLLINMGYKKVYDIGGIINWPYRIER